MALKSISNWATWMLYKRQLTCPTGNLLFLKTRTIFKLRQYIIRTNVLTKVHEDWTKTWLLAYTITINVLNILHKEWTKYVTSRVLKMKTAPPSCSNFHEDLNCFTSSDIIGNIFLTKFNEDWTVNETRRMLT
ncbi:hypothetical protein DPMN_114164 [Dreissena polymorpha]|uniref:Uncharacterized protein n=1 Tax=Dreissena polymorpha TaxID=45954 RepID=A0A9D4KJM9_DREPO|nr:hypothetical protein DPMN_114164 [Dreissena polymorpha]